MNNKIEVQLNDYLGDDLIKEIIEDQIRVEIVKYFKSEESIQRILNNQAYRIVYKMVDESLSDSVENLLEDKVLEIVNNLTEYSIFQKPDAWSRDTNGAYDILKSAIDSNKDRIKAIVEDNIETQVLRSLKSSLKEHLTDAIQDIFTREAVK